MIKNLKNKFNKETVFFIGLFLYLFQNFMRTTTFVDIIPSIIFSIIKYAGLGILLVKAVFLDNYSVNTILVSILFLFIALFSFYFSSEQVMLVILFMIFSCKGIEYRKILKLFLYVEIPLLLVTIVFSKLGIIENLVYNRDENTIRQSLGVVYPTDFAAHVYFIMLAYIIYLSFKDKQI